MIKVYRWATSCQVVQHTFKIISVVLKEWIDEQITGFIWTHPPKNELNMKSSHVAAWYKTPKLIWHHIDPVTWMNSTSIWLSSFHNSASHFPNLASGFHVVSVSAGWCLPIERKSVREKTRQRKDRPHKRGGVLHKGWGDRCWAGVAGVKTMRQEALKCFCLLFRSFILSILIRSPPHCDWFTPEDFFLTCLKVSVDRVISRLSFVGKLKKKMRWWKEVNREKCVHAEAFIRRWKSCQISSQIKNLNSNARRSRFQKGFSLHGNSLKMILIKYISSYLGSWNFL